MSVSESLLLQPPWTYSISRELKSSITSPHFHSAVTVWINKPHTVNRRLIGAKIVTEFEVHASSEDVFNVIMDGMNGLKGDRTIDALESDIQKLLEDGSGGADGVLQVIVRDLVPKQLDRFHTAREVIVKSGDSVGFFPLCHVDRKGDYQHADDTLAYCIKMHEQRLLIGIGPAPQEPPCTALGVSEVWLRDVLTPRLSSWCHADSLNVEASSLRLLAVDEYSAKYQELKARYGPKLVASWQENTDPQKFVYEDIAIATYILLLWEKDRCDKGLTQKQTFVDLGCGNGLLVHLLASEGHKGIGIDLRKRRIWDQYGEETVLKEMSITPSDQHLFPEYDWLIGNHSDELTPWIPVMAARSSFSSNFFVLPCCQWDFSRKFSEKKKGSSQYRSYLDYVARVAGMCGFTVEEDALRIPSTKRVCFIGRNRTYSQEKEVEKDAERTAFIQSRTTLVKRSHSHESSPSIPGKQQKTESNNSQMSENVEGSCPMDVSSEDGVDKWANSFQARKPEEAVSSNCLNVAEDVKKLIVDKVFEALLKAENKKLVDLEERKLQYNMGGSIPLGDVIKLFEPDTLKRLKSECGGMQTLLRNKHQLFHVEKGCVTLRDWTREEQHQLFQQAKKKRKGQKTDTAAMHKTRPCFLYERHPQGCPLVADKCRFAHGEGELREKEKAGAKKEKERETVEGEKEKERETVGREKEKE